VERGYRNAGRVEIRVREVGFVVVSGRLLRVSRLSIRGNDASPPDDAYRRVSHRVAVWASTWLFLMVRTCSHRRCLTLIQLLAVRAAR